MQGIMMEQTLEQRCKVALECLPDARYRTMLAGLFEELLASAAVLAVQRKDPPRVTVLLPDGDQRDVDVALVDWTATGELQVCITVGEQPQEPVAWMAEDNTGYHGLTFIAPQTAEGAWDGFTITPLYAAPQTAVVQPIYEQRLRQVLDVVQRYLPPDGIGLHDAMSEIIGLVDPWPGDTPLARQEPKPDAVYPVQPSSEAATALDAARAWPCVGGCWMNSGEPCGQCPASRRTLGLAALQNVIESLRETGRCVDEEGEATNALADLIDGDAMDAHQTNGLAWAVSCWQAEVSQRPLVNVHRRTLDDTWRQVIRYFGGDPAKLIGPDHDTLMMREQEARAWKPPAAGVALPREPKEPT